MSIDTLDLDDILTFNHLLKSDEFVQLQQHLERRITALLFSHTPESPAFQRMIAQLAIIGSKDAYSLQKEIIALDLHEEMRILQCGLFKDGKRAIVAFFKNHKNEILLAIALIAAAVGIAYLTGYAVSLAAVDAAGGTTLLAKAVNSLFNKKEEPYPYLPKDPPNLSKTQIAAIEQSTQTQIDIQLPTSPNEILVTAKGIWANGQFFSNDQILQNSSFAADLSLAEAHNQQVLANKINSIPEPISASPSVPESGSQNQQFVGFIEKKLEETKNPNYSEQFPKWQTGNPAWLPQPGTPTTSIAFSISGIEKTQSQIGWINGVSNTFEMSKNSGIYLQELSNGYTICGIYNCTHGILVDLAEAAILNYSGYSPNTAKLLQNQWTAFHETNIGNSNAKFLQVCHSQGAIDVRNALEQSSPEIRDRVIVVAIAPGAIVPRGLCFQSYNYASERDLVYKFERPPSPSLEEGAIDDVLVPRFGEEPLSNRDELIILPAHPEAEGFLDHEFQSPTFKPVLRDRLEDYNRHGGEYLPEEKEK